MGIKNSFRATEFCRMLDFSHHRNPQDSGIPPNGNLLKPSSMQSYPETHSRGCPAIYSYCHHSTSGGLSWAPSSAGPCHTDLWVLQGIHKLWAYFRHGDKPTITSQLLRASYEQATLEVGINHLFQSNYKRFGHLTTKTHLSALWMFLDYANLHLRPPRLLLPLKCVDDCLIMEYFGDHPEVSRPLLLSINLCRQWLRVLTLSDITSGDGKSILLFIWRGMPSPCTPPSPLNWPEKVERPAPHHWTIWRRALSLLCTGTTWSLHLPLGAWIIPAPSCEWFYDSIADRLYSYQPHERNYKIYSIIPQRRLRRTRYHCTTFETLSNPPASAACTVVIQINQHIVMHTGTRPTILAAPVDSFQCTDWATQCLRLPSELSPILEGIRIGTAVALCNGSFKDNIGTAAFCIQPDLSGQHRILGCNLTPGHPEQMTPYRSKLGGIYGVVRQVHRLVQDFHITSGSITLACNCLSALKSVFEATSESPNQSDFDLLHDIRAFIQFSPITWKWKHILRTSRPTPSILQSCSLRPGQRPDGFSCQGILVNTGLSLSTLLHRVSIRSVSLVQQYSVLSVG